MPRRELFFTGEHASARVPTAYERLFSTRKAQTALNSHRGFDAGTPEIAGALSRRFRAGYIQAKVTRLLVELNRSTHHPRVFSEFSEVLDRVERERVLRKYYHPHRTRVAETIQSMIDGGACVVHVSVHSFTPRWDGALRTADVGLLYDPARSTEQDFCLAWQRDLRRLDPNLRVRRNYPYRGAADGLTTYLRTRWPESNYLGLELEVNQALVAQGSDRVTQLIRRIGDSLEHTLWASG